MRTVELPDDLYRRLQERATPFEDAPADVIRRALDALEIVEGQRNHADEEVGSALAKEASEELPAWRRKLLEITGGADLVSHVGRVPHGTKLRTRYRGKEYYAEVLDAWVVWNGQRYPSLSQAAVAVIQSTGSPRPTENGWRFWEYLDETTGEWRRLAELRAA